ncbi:hypothetical protein MHJ82_01590 [Corynebacterium afermentans]|uniref:hypothetical protein n=1 Tax=Corynebacterium afermentans TaxID=38286 RepID=UPI00257313DE|nr:hypothetical protein [Corynebacterium afermentans]MCG7273034.1 hypothetical protein [Corynebacterium afermentans]
MKRKIISAVAAAALCLGAVACGAEETNDTDHMLEVSSGPLTVRVPESWSEFDKSSDPDSIKDPWVVGARDSEDAMTVQIRLSKDTGVAPQADATNAAVLYGNIFAQDTVIEPKGEDAAEVDGANKAIVSYFEAVDDDGDYWDGLFLSAENSETGNVSTMEMISLRGEGLSQDEAKEIIANATYDKSKE